jgi:hypothetical protein
MSSINRCLSGVISGLPSDWNVGYWNNPPPVWRKPRAHQLQDLHLPPAIVALSQPFTARRFSSTTVRVPAEPAVAGMKRGAIEGFKQQVEDGISRTANYRPEFELVLRARL